MDKKLVTPSKIPTLAGEIVDMREPGFLLDPHSYYRRMREKGRVHRDGSGRWLLLSHADCRAAVQSEQLSRSVRNWKNHSVIHSYMASSKIEKTIERFMFFNDPPFHTRIRKLMNVAFAPTATKALTQSIEIAAQNLVNALPMNEPFDFIKLFAQILPVRVISSMLGVGEEDFEQTKAWSDAIARVAEPVASRSLRDASNQACIEMTEFLRKQVTHRRAAPGEALLDVLIAGQKADPNISDDDLLANLMLLYIAGHETTKNLLGNGLFTLLNHPEQVHLLRLNEKLLPIAIEELIRFESPLNIVPCFTREPWKIDDLEIPAGEMICCMTGAANRDPEVFDRPDVFDIMRSPNPHLSFGGGAHYCIGAPVARLEAQVAFRKIFQKFKTLKLASNSVEWQPFINLRGLVSLNVIGSD